MGFFALQAWLNLSKAVVWGVSVDTFLLACYNSAMNGYDFDATILKGNTVQRFWWYCSVRFVYLWLLLPEILLANVLFLLHVINKEIYLRMMEFFVVFVPNKRKQAVRFWNKNQKHVKQWYLDAKKENDVVVSASPDFLLDEICSRLQVKCICTKTRPCGLPQTVHCYGAQKVVEYKANFGDQPLQSFYSDSMSDAPMFQLAEKGYFVRGNEITLIYQNGEKLPAARN